MTDGWTKVGGNTDRAEQFKFEKAGDEISGTYVDVREIPNKLQPGQMTKIHILRLPDGTERAIFGKTALDRNLSRVSVGSDVKIVYLGKEKNPKTGFSFHNFDVYSKRPATAAADQAEDVSDDIPF